MIGWGVVNLRVATPVPSELVPVILKVYSVPPKASAPLLRFKLGICNIKEFKSTPLNNLSVSSLDKVSIDQVNLISLLVEPSDLDAVVLTMATISRSAFIASFPSGKVIKIWSYGVKSSLHSFRL